MRWFESISLKGNMPALSVKSYTASSIYTAIETLLQREDCHKGAMPNLVSLYWAERCPHCQTGFAWNMLVLLERHCSKEVNPSQGKNGACWAVVLGAGSSLSLSLHMAKVLIWLQESWSGGCRATCRAVWGWEQLLTLAGPAVWSTGIYVLHKSTLCSNCNVATSGDT